MTQWKKVFLLIGTINIEFPNPRPWYYVILLTHKAFLICNILKVSHYYVFMWSNTCNKFPAIPLHGTH